MAATYVGKPVASYSNMSSQNQMPSNSRSLDLAGGNYVGQSGMVGEMYYGGSDLLRSLPLPTDSDKPMIVELAVAAMEELSRLALSGDPLWVPAGNSCEILNEDEYVRVFPRGLGPKPLGFRTEASRESVVVIMNHINLVEILMDVVSNVYIIILFFPQQYFHNHN